MARLFPVFLVLLRLAIGWHLLIEGLEKINSQVLGPTETNRPWSGAGYLRGASGPVGALFRGPGRRPGKAALERLTLLPLPDGDRTKVPYNQRFPPALAKDWDDYYQRFAQHYDLSNDKAQQQAAEAKVDQRKGETGNWLENGTKEITKNFPSGAVTRTATTPERVKEYQSKLEELREVQTKKLPAFGNDVEKAKLRALRADVNRLRTQLLADLEEQTNLFKAALDSVLTPEQKKKAKLDTTPHGPPWRAWREHGWLTWAGLGDYFQGAWKRNYNHPHDWLRRLSWWAVAACGLWLVVVPLSRMLWNVFCLLAVKSPRWSLLSLGGWWGCIVLLVSGTALLYLSLVRIVPVWSGLDVLDLADWSVMFGLSFVGACLIAGVFTRSACVAGACLLLMFYLAMPPWPGVPENLMTEGHYLFINKNLIEMLALLTLACTSSGRYAGLDGLLQFIDPWRWRKKLVPKVIPPDLGALTPRPDLAPAPTKPPVETPSPLPPTPPPAESKP